MLNPQQRRVVTHDNGHMLVLAGAGSGKTKILVHRIAWLVQHGYSTDLIMAVTFTNKAAKEMRQRLEKLLERELNDMWIGTFHGLAHRMLRRHHQAAGLIANFQIIDNDDQQRLLRAIHKELNLDKNLWPVSSSLKFISACKEKGIRSDQMVASGLHEQQKLAIYQRYEELCRRSHLMDFGELLLRCFELLQQNSDLRQHYQQQFQQILVDEFQDTNSMQYAWIQLLSQHAYLLAVGDDDQSIYSWRGAEVANMQRLQQDYQGIELIRLEQNYRSTATILAAANQVIAHNRHRLGKQLWTRQSGGAAIVVYHAANSQDEARYIAQQIKQYVEQGGHWQDVAILYRSNSQSRVLEELLTNSRVPYRIYGGLRFYERAEVKDLLAYLKLLCNECDDVALTRIINLPNRGIGETTLQRLQLLACQRQLTLMEAIRYSLSENLWSRSGPASKLQSFLNLIVRFQQLAEQFSLAELANYIQQELRLVEYYQKFEADDKEDDNQQPSKSGSANSSTSPLSRSISREENLRELIASMRQFEQENYASEQALGDHIAITASELLQDYLAAVTLNTDLEEVGRNDGHDSSGGDASATATPAVSLMTLHAAKGLEFPVVFITGMEEGSFPHAMAFNRGGSAYFNLYNNNDNDVEEERRLCYVGMTRAQKQLYLSWREHRYNWSDSGMNKISTRSRFLRELPEEGVEEVDSDQLASSGSYNGYDSYNAYNNYSANHYYHQHHQNSKRHYAINNTTDSSRPALAQHVQERCSKLIANNQPFRLQQRVYNSAYGIGTVVGFAENDCVKVLFDRPIAGRQQIKTIRADYLNIQS